MKKKSVMVVGLMLLSTLIFAQRFHGDPKVRAARHSEKMKKVLHLNDEQFGKVQVINEQFAESRRKLKSDTSVTVGHARTQWRKLAEAHRADLKNVLTAEQWDRWKDVRKKKHEHNRHHRDMGRG